MLCLVQPKQMKRECKAMDAEKLLLSEESF